MITVIVSYPNGEREEVILAGVPRIGESVRLNSGDPSQAAFIVEHVIWTEGGGNGRRDAEVILTIRKRTDQP